MEINDINFDNFDWNTYININEDLKKDNILDKQSAWNHWLNHGCNEERPLSLINNTNVHNGRFGNLFFVNMVVHFISIKTNLKCRYKYYSKFEKMGIFLHIGKNTYNNNLIITDDNFLNIIKNENLDKQNIIINNDSWFQTCEFSYFLKTYFNLPCNRAKIIDKNIFKKRYNNNNDLFIHVRLGDLENQIENVVDYYDKILSTTEFVTGFITSDTIEHKICQDLINKYSLLVINKDEVFDINYVLI